MYADFLAEEPAIFQEKVDSYVKQVEEANSSVYAYLGEAHTKLYSSPRLMAAFRHAKDRGVSIKMITGPVLNVALRDGKRYSGLVELCKEGVIELYRRPTRGYHKHYRIIDEDPNIAYSEDAHEPLTPLFKRSESLVPNTSLAPHFQATLGHKTEVLRSTNPEKDFLLLTEPEIVAVQDLASERYPNLRYDDLTFDQLRALYKEVRDEWKDRLQKLDQCFTVEPSRK